MLIIPIFDIVFRIFRLYGSLLTIHFCEYYSKTQKKTGGGIRERKMCIPPPGLRQYVGKNTIIRVQKGS